MDIYIYALQDPRTDEYRYVGRTNRLRKRAAEHFGARNHHSPHCHNWVKALKRLGLVPKIIILEIANESTWAEAEQWWIHHLRVRELQDLTNITAGGRGALERKLTEEAKRRIAIAYLGNKGWPGGKHTEESKRKMSRARRGRVFSAETKRKMSESRKRYFAKKRENTEKEQIL